LAVVLLAKRNFKEEDFANFHPGGTLGKRLLIRVKDIMHTEEELPIVGHETPISDGLLEMSQKSLGITAVVDNDANLLGVFTDGDLRRTLDQRTDIHSTPISKVMTIGGKTIKQNQLAMEAVHLMEENGITALLVIDSKNKLVGALNIHDLFRAGIM
ncbi:MAG: CBS domain-containing protein, partial [Gammaproteobacteria bacterium]|nr:CBS domain-containing protein [Gammaproteobacteria bacterium]